jgi:hypothetical protein
VFSYIDGEGQRQEFEGNPADITFPESGEFEVSIQIFIGDEVIDAGPIPVTVADPVSVVVTSSSETPTVGEELTLTADVQPEGTVADLVEFVLLDESGEEVARVSGSPATLVVPNDGNFNLVSEVTVGDETTVSDPIEITSTLPEISVDLTAREVLVNEPSSFSVDLQPEGTEADRIVFSYVDGEGQRQEFEGNPADITFPESGNFDVMAQVFIGEEIIDAGPFPVTVSAPTFSIDTTATEVLIDEPITFTATVTPVDAPLDSIRFVTSDGRTFDGPSADISFPNAGEFTVTTELLVGDEVVSEETTITVIEPVSVSIDSSSTTATVGEALTLTANIQPEGTVADSIEFTTSDGQTILGSPASVVFPAAGTFTITGAVTVDGETTTSDSISVTVNLPSITPSAGASDALVNEPVTFSVDLQPVGTIADRIVFSYVDGDGTTQEFEGSPVDITFPESGNFTVTGQVFIGDEVLDAGSFPVSVTAPTVEVVASETDVLTGEVISFTVTTTPEDAPFDRIEVTTSDGQTVVGSPANISFPAAGNFTATATVFVGDEEVVSDTINISVNAPIVAVIESSTLQAVIDLPVTLTAQVTPIDAVVDQVVFTTSDGQTINGSPADVTFTTAGTFTVTAEVTSGTQVVTTTEISIVVTEQMPEFVSIDVPTTLTLIDQMLPVSVSVAPVDAVFDRVVLSTSDGQSFEGTTTDFSFATSGSFTITADVFIGTDVIVSNDIVINVTDSEDSFPEEFNFSGRLGDVNGDGDITLDDAVLAAQRLGGLRDPLDRDEIFASDVDVSGEFNQIDAELIANIVASDEFVARFISPPTNLPGGTSVVISPNLVAPLESIAITVNGIEVETITQFAQGYANFVIPANPLLAGATADVEVTAVSGGVASVDNFTVELGNLPTFPADATADIVAFLDEFERAYELQQTALDDLLVATGATDEEMDVITASLTLGLANVAATLDVFRDILADNSDSQIAFILQQALYANGLEGFRDQLTTLDSTISTGVIPNPQGLLEVCDSVVPALCNIQDSADLGGIATTLIGLSCDALESSVLVASLPADAVQAWTEQCPVVTSELAFASTLSSLFGDVSFALDLQASPDELPVGESSDITATLNISGGDNLRRIVDAQALDSTGDDELAQILADEVIGNLLAGRTSEGALVDLLDILDQDLLARLSSEVQQISGRTLSDDALATVIANFGNNYLMTFVDQPFALDATQVFMPDAATGGVLTVASDDAASFACFAPGDAQFQQFATLDADVQIRGAVQNKSIEITCGLITLNITFGDQGAVFDSGGAFIDVSDVFELQVNGESVATTSIPDNASIDLTVNVPIGANRFFVITRGENGNGGSPLFRINGFVGTISGAERAAILADRVTLNNEEPIAELRITFSGILQAFDNGVPIGSGIDLTIEVEE